MKGLVLALAISTLALGASSLYLWRRLDAQHAQAEAVRSANAALMARIGELERRRAEYAGLPADAVLAEEGAPQKRSDLPPGADASNSTGRDDGPDSGPDDPDDSDRPEIPEAMHKMLRANVRARNRRLYFDVQSKLGLTDAQTSDLFDLLSDERRAGFKGVHDEVFDPDAARTDAEAEQRRRQAALEDVLGAAKAAEFTEYQKTTPSRSQLLMIAQQLDGVEAPLTDSQRSRLLDVLVAERERIPEPAVTPDADAQDAPKAYIDWQADYEKRVDEAARSILTAEQLNTLTAYQQWEREIRQHFAVPSAPGESSSAVAAPAPVGMSRRLTPLATPAK